MTKDPRAELPLSPAVLQILLALSAGERHGYAIAQEVEAATDGQIRMGPGTLYGSIRRMTAGALIEEAARPRADRGADPRRRYYRVTTYGRRVLELELDRLLHVIRLARDQRLIRAPGHA